MASSMYACGGQHEVIGPILWGQYQIAGTHHGNVMYVKTEPVNVVLYYWDDRDGSAFCGWWFAWGWSHSWAKCWHEDDPS